MYQQMSPERIRHVVSLYRTMFIANGVKKKDFPFDKRLSMHDFGPEHCHGMLAQMELFITEGKMDKVNCWLGFIQDVLWSQGFYTLEELMKHNRDPKDEVKSPA